MLFIQTSLEIGLHVSCERNKCRMGLIYKKKTTKRKKAFSYISEKKIVSHNIRFNPPVWRSLPALKICI